MSARVLGLLAGGLLIIALWAGYERRHPHPLINVRRVLNLSATPAFFIAGMCGAIAVFTNPAQVVYLQMPNAAVGHGLSQTVLQVAYVLRAVSIAVVVGGFVTAPLITRFAPPPPSSAAQQSSRRPHSSSSR